MYLPHTFCQKPVKVSISALAGFWYFKTVVLAALRI